MAEQLAQLGSRLVAVHGLQRHAGQEVVCGAVTVEAVDQQLRLDRGVLPVRVCNLASHGGILDEVADLEPTEPVACAQVLCGRALTALRHAAERNDVNRGQEAGRDAGMHGR